MKNQKGFTLVELLVVMVILSIITAISIPLIRNIRQGNTQKEYENYANSIKYGAKLYVDSYGEDLFGHNESGCAIITYQDLKDKNLVKDFDKDNISCASEDTFVRVVKMGGKYGYASSIGCGKKDSKGNVDVSIKYPRNGVNIDTCDLDAKAIMSFRTDITNPNSFKYKTRSMKVIISSITGINSNPIVQYGFSDIKNGSTVSNWGQLEIKPESISIQTDKILAGETIEVTSQQIHTPTGLTGRYYLVLRIDRLQDIDYKNWTQEGEDPYVYLGPYQLDNTKPEFNDSTVISSNTSYNALKPKLDLKVTDEISAHDDTSARENLRMCVSFDTDSCLKTNAAFKDDTKYEAYNPSKVLDKVQNSYDGSSHKVYVTVADPASNYQTKEFTYEIAIRITYNGNGSTEGSMTASYCNKNVACTLKGNTFTRTGYTFAGWYNQASGGTKYGASPTFTANTTVYAHWDSAIYTITFDKKNGTGGNDAIYEKYGTGWYSNATGTTAITSITNPTRENYSFAGYFSAETGGDRIVGKNGSIVASNTKFTNNATAYARWCRNCNAIPNGSCTLAIGNDASCTYTTTCDANYTISNNGKYNASCSGNVYAITLNKQSGSGGTNTIYEKYGTGWYSNAAGTTAITSVTAPTRDSYSFAGYFTETNGGGTQITNKGGTIVGANTTYNAAGTAYAKWCHVCNTIANGSCTLTVGNNGTCSYDTSCNAGYVISNDGKYNATCTQGTFTVTYNGNNASAANVPAAQTKYAGTDLTLSSQVPTLSGYTFAGWATSSSGNVAYSAGGTYTQDANITLYAKWDCITKNEEKYITCDSYHITRQCGTTCYYDKKNGASNSGNAACTGFSSSPSNSCNNFSCDVYYNSRNGNNLYYTIQGDSRCRFTKFWTGAKRCTPNDNITDIGSTVDTSYPTACTGTTATNNFSTISKGSGSRANVSFNGKSPDGSHDAGWYSVRCADNTPKAGKICSYSSNCIGSGRCSSSDAACQKRCSCDKNSWGLVNQWCR